MPCCAGSDGSRSDGGTLFLDEIGELTPVLQSKLLRAIQERTIERLGSGTPIRVDLRLITATSRDLEKAVSEGQFREDLYYRLNVVVIELPPLRERRQDIPCLVEHFLRRGGRNVSMSPAALNILCDYHWPGMCANWRIRWNGRQYWPKAVSLTRRTSS